MARARFYLTTNNSRGNQVTAANPSFVHIRGWDVGVNVDAVKDVYGDRFDIYTTSGSNDTGRHHYVGSVILRDGKPTFVSTEAQS